MPKCITILATHNHLRHKNKSLDHNLSFLTIISLGLHSMEHGRDCHINIRSATHNIIGLGIKTLTIFPIDSSTESTQESLVFFRQQFQHFIKNTVNSKINDHLSKHGPDPDLYPALRSSLARELSIWTILRQESCVTPRSYLVRLCSLCLPCIAVNFTKFCFHYTYPDNTYTPKTITMYHSYPSL